MKSAFEILVLGKSTYIGERTMPQSTAQVTPATSRPNTSTLSGRSNPNAPKPEGGAVPAPTNSPSIGTTYTLSLIHI